MNRPDELDTNHDYQLHGSNIQVLDNDAFQQVNSRHGFCTDAQ
jgi:hypothetical protein